jgi:hypothetical protein
MLEIHYDPDSGTHIMPDNTVEDFVKSCCATWNNSNKERWIFCVGNMLVLDCFRVYVKEGMISYKEIVFVYEGAYYYLNEDGRYISNNFPYGMIDNFLNRLI